MEEQEINTLKDLITSGRVNVNEQNEDNGTILMAAVANQATGFVAWLLKNTKANTNLQDSNGETALHYAIDNVEITQLLLDHGADPTIQNNTGATPRDCSTNSQTKALTDFVSFCKIGKCAERGFRCKLNEDTILGCELIPQSPFPLSVFGVFDGYQCDSASLFCRDQVVPTMQRKFEFLKSDMVQGLKHIFIDLDQQMQQPKYQGIFETAGTTACVAVLTEDLSLYVANAGDSRCIAQINGKLEVLSNDHTTANKQEIERMTTCKTKLRSNNPIWFTRCLGDYRSKDPAIKDPTQQCLTCVPEVQKKQLNPDDFVIVATDGLWNALSNESVFAFVQENVEKKVDLSEIAQKLCQEAIALGSLDNVSVVICRVLASPHFNKN